MVIPPGFPEEWTERPQCDTRERTRPTPPQDSITAIRPSELESRDAVRTVPISFSYRGITGVSLTWPGGQALVPTYRRHFVVWIHTAKRPETREGVFAFFYRFISFARAAASMSRTTS